MNTRVDIRFEAHGDGETLMTVVQSGFPVPEVRDFFVGEVWNGAFDCVEAYLSRSR